MFDISDHPVVTNLCRTGYPDGREPEDFACPVCGSVSAEDFFVAAGNTVVGCDICLRRVPYHEFEANEYEAEDY